MSKGGRYSRSRSIDPNILANLKIIVCTWSLLQFAIELDIGSSVIEFIDDLYRSFYCIGLTYYSHGLTSEINSAEQIRFFRVFVAKKQGNKKFFKKSTNFA